MNDTALPSPSGSASPAPAASPAAGPARSGFDGRIRAVIENVSPAVDGGRFPVKRTLGDSVVVEADCFADGHDVVAALLLWRRAGDARWHARPMTALPNDRWRAPFMNTWPARGVGLLRRCE